MTENTSGGEYFFGLPSFNRSVDGPPTSQTGVCIATLARHDYAIGALAWLPDGRGFVSGGMDSKICFWVCFALYRKALSAHRRS